jgi:hypothetical protein
MYYVYHCPDLDRWIRPWGSTSMNQTSTLRWERERIFYNDSEVDRWINKALLYRLWYMDFVILWRSSLMLRSSLRGLKSKLEIKVFVPLTMDGDYQQSILSTVKGEFSAYNDIKWNKEFINGCSNNCWVTSGILLYCWCFSWLSSFNI